MIHWARPLPGGICTSGSVRRAYRIHQVWIACHSETEQTEEKAVKGEFFTHPVCDRFLTLTRRWQGLSWQVYTLNHDITCAVLRGDSQGDLRLFKLRTLDHIPSLKTAKQRHLNKVQISEAECHSSTQGSWDCDPPYTVPPGSEASLRSQMYKRPNPTPFRCTLMSSELKESQVGFDLKDKAHPSHTHGIKKKIKNKKKHWRQPLFFSWEKRFAKRKKKAKPKRFISTSNSDKMKELKPGCSERGQNLFAPRLKESSLTWGNDLPERLLDSVACSPIENSF